MMTSIKWLIDLALQRPLIFSVALLLIGIVVGGDVIYYQQKRIESLEVSVKDISRDSNHRIDSVRLYYEKREEQLNAETKATLKSMVDDYRRQLMEQESLDRKIDNTIIRNARILRDKQEQLKMLNNDDH